MGNKAKTTAPAKRSLIILGTLLFVVVSMFAGTRAFAAATQSTSAVRAHTAVTAPQTATVLYADVQVDTSCNGAECSASSLAEANTTRKLAVGADGSIYATYWNSTGIYVAKSTNRG